jgi:raffinose/stachyose/melibiose transport system substrate-binding protein
MNRKMYLAMSVVLVLSFILAACATPAATTAAPAATEAATKAPVATEAATTAPAAKVTINWWHISTKDPALSDWQKMANDYMAAHPNVDIKITVLENEAFKTKLTTVLQSGDVPDIFQSWGGGTLKEQVDAGLVKDITSDLDANNGEWRNSFGAGPLGVFAFDGKNYGVPWDMGMVSFWYNKDLFAKAGIATTPTTWTEFLADVTKLKAAGITPISVGEGDKWPGMHMWAYLVTRIGGEAAFNAVASGTGKWTDPAFIQASDELVKLINMQPFQDGFLGATHDEMQATFGNGEAAMELGGQWSPSVEAANSADSKGVKNLGMFNFPAVEGGAGAATDAMGGGNGFAIGKNASPEAIDFVKYLTSVANQSVVAGDGTAIPVVKGAESALKDPNMQLVAKSFGEAKYFQLYFDTYLGSDLGSALNDSIQKLYAGTATSQQVCAEIEAAWEAKK